MKFPLLPLCTPAVLRRATSAFLRITVITAAFYANTTWAYVEEGPAWSGGTVTFQFALGSAGKTLSDGNTSWDSAALPAPDAWNAIMGNLHFTGILNPSAPLSSGDGVNTIAFSNSVFGQSFGSTTLAVTYYRYSGGRMSEADVLVNKAWTWDSYRGALRFGSNGYAVPDIRRVLIHELGHALGLAHPDQNGQNVDAIMNSMISSRETVSNDDISGAQALYGAPSVSPTPTPTPTPTPAPTATPTPTPRPTATPTPTPTPVPTATPTPTPRPTATPTPTPVSTPSITISVSTAIVKAGQKATFTFTASAASASTVTVSYSMGGTAAQGNAYSLSGTSGKVTIPAQSTVGTVTLTALKDPASTKSAVMTITSGTGYKISSPSSATVSIK